MSAYESWSCFFKGLNNLDQTISEPYIIWLDLSKPVALESECRYIYINVEKQIYQWVDHLEKPNL